MAGEVLSALVDRSGIDPAAVEDVVMGCVSQAGEQGFHVGRNAVLASRLPDSVPAVTIDRQCGSSQQALHFAAQAVMSGTQDVVIAAGVESMSRVPMGTPWTLHAKAGIGVGPFSGDRRAVRGGGLQPVRRRGDDRRQARLRREELDAYALEATGAPRRPGAGAFGGRSCRCASTAGRRAEAHARTKASASTRRWRRSGR
jgi:acetyl-CoA C-acetyltransferase